MEVVECFRRARGSATIELGAGGRKKGEQVTHRREHEQRHPDGEERAQHCHSSDFDDEVKVEAIPGGTRVVRHARRRLRRVMKRVSEILDRT